MKFITTNPPKDTATITWSTSSHTVLKVAEKRQELSVGIGSATHSLRSGMRALRKAVRIAREHSISAIQMSVDTLPFPKEISQEELGRLCAENMVLANYEFTKYKKPQTYTGIQIVCVEHASKEFVRGLQTGSTVAMTINEARSLANTPGGDMTPEVLAQAAKKMLSGTTATVKILLKKDIEKLKMGMMLGVAKGSVEEPRFIIVEYFGGSKEKPVVLVGKGVTFDTGGLDLKPADGMLGMHHDMSGGAAVIAAVAVAAKLKLKKNVVALVPAVENAISGEAYRPGDILTAHDGTTVEVLNTDAEGRLILGDALSFAATYKPRLTIDVATLTGAAEVALGNRASALFTRNRELEDQLRMIAEMSGDYIWPLPLWEEYEKDIKGTHAELSNIASQNSRKGGAIIGATFLAHFARSLPLWAHIDIAPRDGAIPEDNLAKGATGEPIRLLVRTIESF